MLFPQLPESALLALGVLFGTAGCGQGQAIDSGLSTEANTSSSASSEELTAAGSDAVVDITPGSGVGSTIDSTGIDLQAQINALVAASPGAQQTSENEVSWNHGAVVLSFPTSVIAPLGSVKKCPSGWYCFYEHENFGGRMLTFRDCASSGTKQYLTDYGFGDMTTSWVVNRDLKSIAVYDNIRNRYLWTEGPYAQSSNVGATNNDRADYFICYGK